ncbi:Hypothetical protein, putative [Bodo saltans]|uniref:RNA editing complex protein MP61 n=1 Tax=Bodo saltans TaxID=75058 RepID=A0A0S4JKE9_BODSA|nr:Hypothetical protein, putative [Bodo saltans]|eukprot:CUG90628.1 Hypothetical protein, putative [Bodo saltans]
MGSFRRSGLLKNVPSPYRTEGGHVPIYSVAHGRIQKRNWIFRNASWCDLCKEPVALWVNHHGRKDHALLDLHYSQMVEWPRRWRAEDILHTFLSQLKVPIDRYQAQYSHHDRERRNEIYSMIVKLEAEGVLFLGEPRQSFLFRMQGGLRGMDHQGALVLHEFILGPFMRLYPEGGIQDFSNLVDFVTCSYNMETVYDLCGFYSIDRSGRDMKPSSPAAMGLGGIASSSSATTGFQSTPATSSTQAAPATATEIAKAEQEEEDAFSRKAVFVRQLLGQLRWVLDDDREHPTGKVFAPHIVVLSEILIKALVAEIIAVRICEYVVRVEPVWRDFGFERKALAKDTNKELKRPTVTPPPGVRFFYRHMSEKHDDLYDAGAVVRPPPKDW